jgi:NTP pyrophosphatase (non-canonical NTP hydrolase)
MQDLLTELRNKSVERAKTGFKCYDNQPLTYWTTAIAGEVGELCNMVKKMQRVKMGGVDDGRSYAAKDITREMIEEEIGGIAIYLDLIASLYDINLSDAIVNTFNSKSEKYGFPEMLTPVEKVMPVQTCSGLSSRPIELLDAMKAVNQWLNSSDTWCTDGNTNVIADAYIHAKPGTLLQRMIAKMTKK